MKNSMGWVIRSHPAKEGMNETKIDRKKLGERKMEKQKYRRKCLNESVGDIAYIVRRRSIVCLIEDAKEKNRKNGAEALFEESNL